MHLRDKLEYMIIAVDTGGTKTLVARFAPDGTCEKTDKFATPHDTDTYLDQLSASIALLSEQATPSVIVVAMPGWIEHDIVVDFGNLPWHNFAIKAELSKRFRGTRILVENDANLGGLGEAHQLSVLPHRCLYITVSTGIGGGFIVNGTIDTTMRTMEIGHMQLEIEGEITKWETVASGKALFNNYHEFASDMTDQRHWRAVATRLSRGFLAFLPILRPDLVIIGGSVGAHLDHFAEYLNESIEKHVAPHYRCPIVAAKHPEEAVIYGCYQYAIEHA